MSDMRNQRIEWSVVPYKENLKKTAIVICVILGCGLFVYLAFKDLFLAILSVVILFASLHTYFSKTTYYLDDKQLVIKSSMGKTVKEWGAFKRYYLDNRGITLSPFAKRSRLEPFRSVRLLFRGNKDEVVSFISERLGGRANTGADR